MITVEDVEKAIMEDRNDVTYDLMEYIKSINTEFALDAESIERRLCGSSAS